MNIIIALDDIANSRALFQFVCGLESYEHSNFRLIHVVNPIMVNEHPFIAYAPFLEPAQDEYIVQARKMLIDAAAELHKSAGAHNVINADVLIGLPTAILLEQIREWPADLIVVGSHNRSEVGRLFLGSVSREIVSNSPCSVMVVKLEDVQQKPLSCDVSQAALSNHT